MSQSLLEFGGAGAVMLFMFGMTCSAASGQTQLPHGFEIRLLPGYVHQPLQGIDSLVGKISKNGGLEIEYEMGPVPEKGAPITGGSFFNQALKVPEERRLWMKEQMVDGQNFSLAYSKDRRLLISTSSATQGINFSARAESADEITDVLLMVLTFREQQPK